MNIFKHLKRKKKYIPFDKTHPDNSGIRQTALYASSQRSKNVGDVILKRFNKDGYTVLRDGKPWDGKDKLTGSGFLVFDIKGKDGEVIPNAVLKVIYHNLDGQYTTFAEIWDRQRFEREH